MKILFFLLALVNVGLLMWEYRQGVFAPEQNSSSGTSVHYQEQILLVSERGNVSP